MTAHPHPHLLAFTQGMQINEPPEQTVRDLGAMKAFGDDVKGGRTRVQFFPAYVEFGKFSPSQPGEKVVERGGRRYVVRDHVGIVCAGDRLSVAVHVVDDFHKRVYADAWNAYERQEDVPDYGTPIHELPGIVQRDILLLKLANVNTIEEVSGLDDSTVREIGQFAGVVRQKARQWLEKLGESEASARLAEIEAERGAEKKQIDDFMASMEARMKQLADENAVLQKALGQGGQNPQRPVPPGAILAGTPEADATLARGRGSDAAHDDPLSEGSGEWSGDDSADFDPVGAVPEN